MARRTDIPHWRADRRGSYILPSDGSLDRDRYERELQQLREEGRPVSEHPLNAWWGGRGRFDLDAVDYFDGCPVTIRSYFNQEEPEVFELRRLSWEEYDECRPLPMLDPDDTEELALWQIRMRPRVLLACRYGVVKVTNSTLADKVERDRNRLSSDSMQVLHDVSPDLPLALGYAVLNYSRPLEPNEKGR